MAETENETRLTGINPEPQGDRLTGSFEGIKAIAPGPKETLTKPAEQVKATGTEGGAAKATGDR
jgi:hypothetical protein